MPAAMEVMGNTSVAVFCLGGSTHVDFAEAESYSKENVQ